MRHALFLLSLGLLLVGLGPASGSPGQELTAFEEGNRHLQEGDHRRAIAAYRLELKARPKNAFAHFNLALALEATGEFEPALEQARQVVELDPPEAYTLVPGMIRRPYRTLELEPANLLRLRGLTLEGRLLNRLGRAEAALPVLQEAAVWASGNEIDAFRELAEAARATGREGVALHFFHHYLEQAMLRTDVTSDLAVWGPGYLRARLPFQTPLFLRSLSYRVDPEGRVRVGPIPLGLTLPEQAHALRIGPDGVARAWEQSPLPVPVGRLLLYPAREERMEPVEPARNGEGRIVSGHRLLEPDQTQVVWEQLQEFSPELYQQILESPFLSSQDRLEQLLSLQRAPGYKNVRLAHLYLQLWADSRHPDDLEQAASHFEAALEHAPDLDQSYYNLAAVRFLQGEPDSGLELLSKAAGLEPRRSAAWRFQLQLFLSVGYLDQALETARAYSQCFPHDPLPRYAEAEILTELEREDEAMEAVEQLLEQNPFLVEAGYLKVRLLARAGRFRDQVGELERLLKLDPFPYRGQRMLASLIERLGQQERARKLYEEYLLSPIAPFVEPAEYRKILEEIFQVREL